MNYIFLAAVTGDFAAEHPYLNGLLDALCGLGGTFGDVADNLKKITVDVSTSSVATAINGIGAGLVTFFMVLEIITYCFNVDFHAGERRWRACRMLGMNEITAVVKEFDDEQVAKAALIDH